MKIGGRDFHGFAANTKPCESWLASDDGCTFNIDAGWSAAITGKPAPTGLRGILKIEASAILA